MGTGFCHLMGSCFYEVAVNAGCVANLSPLMTLLFSSIPLTIGGCCFFAGSLFEARECCLYKFRNTSQWWAVLFSLAGSSCYCFAGPCYLAVVDFDIGGNLAIGMAGLNFVHSCMFQLFLWRDEQYGLAFSTQMSSKYGKTPKDAEQDRFSLFGLVVITLFCWFGMVATLAMFSESYVSKVRLMEAVVLVSFHVLVLILIHLLLAERGTVVRTPTTQPWELCTKVHMLSLSWPALVL